MTQSTIPKANLAFTDFEGWRVHLPEEFRELSQAAWLAKSRRGDWAGYLKPLGERSAPQWRKSDITLFFKLKFGVLYPEAVQSLLTANFSEPEQPKVRLPKKSKGKVRRD